jgi:hypothetical protein
VAHIEKMENVYKNKETGKVEELSLIKNDYEELLSNTNEFEEYRDNFDKYLNDFYN